jgi:hypothetical protein
MEWWLQMDDLIRNLTKWESFYLAGQLHKPTLPIPLQLLRTVPDELVQAQTTNLQATMAVALLILPSPVAPITTMMRTKMDSSSSNDSVSWLTLYSQIANFRMQFGGGDPLKVSKLVQAPGQLKRFQSLYQPILEPLQQAGILSSSLCRLK